MKFVLLVILGLLLACWILSRRRRDPGRRDAPPPAALGEDMVRCERCGVHLPRSESLTTQGRFYCTAEHRQEHENS